MRFGKFRFGKGRIRSHLGSSGEVGVSAAERKDTDASGEAVRRVRGRADASGGIARGNGRADSGKAVKGGIDRVFSQGGALHDRGNYPAVVDIATEARLHSGKRKILWSGKRLQIALESIGGEATPALLNSGSDMAVYVLWGEGSVAFGRRAEDMGEKERIRAGCEIIIPEGAYYSIASNRAAPLEAIVYYAPKKYPFGHSEK